MSIKRINDVASYTNDAGDPMGAPLVVAIFPESLLTDPDDGMPRLRVDVAQTGFFLGHQFRTLKEWTEAFTGEYVIRVDIPIDIILFSLVLELDAGSARIETLAGGQEGGTFSEALPIFPSNTMGGRPQPYYHPMVELTAGGTHTGGTLLDVVRVRTSDNSNFGSSVGASSGAERGVGPGTYYFKITLAAATGVFRARWEERP